MKLGDKAQETPDVRLARDSSPGLYQFVTDELVSADALTGEEQFPQYGDFLEVGRPSSDSTVFIECPQALAAWLIENDVEDGDWFRITSVQKVDRRWQYSVEVAEAPGDVELE
jgi:hypothetical protein